MPWSWLMVLKLNEHIIIVIAGHYIIHCCWYPAKKKMMMCTAKFTVHCKDYIQSNNLHIPCPVCFWWVCFQTALCVQLQGMRWSLLTIVASSLVQGLQQKITANLMKLQYSHIMLIGQNYNLASLIGAFGWLKLSDPSCSILAPL
mgnify:CR=1 FL=1